MEKWIKKIKFWCLTQLFTQDEKYLLNKVLEDKIQSLERTLVTERWVDPEKMNEEIDSYHKIQKIFSETDYLL